ncbi:MmpS family transport accessory protein [Flavobacterium sp. LHD-85]|uniref:MmpS family transport accessory protein n=1 Tax=Flavobacterium sp. LHD-85 TaxID=3071410 RepID=UPI0027E1FEB5|nr:MmpS family transport accessory protein [Flavobacterium sp. LHD-85]MDQ6529008.1 MmpS family transport accessory protein [Flavobacterium sp. LHD-85]
MKSILKTLAIVMTLAFTAVSCSSDNDDKGGSNSRDVKYEITGNYTGTLSTTYFEKGGNALNEDITKLPWTKEFTADAKSIGASLSASGYGGTPGQTLTGKIYIGGKLENELTATANSDGIIVLPLTPYVFPQ